MKMKVLLIARIPAYFEYMRTDQEVFPPFQIQSLWLNAFASLGIEYETFIVSKSLFLPSKWAAYLEVFQQKNAPKLYAKIQKAKNLLHAFRLSSWYRSCKLASILKTKKIDTIVITGGISELVGFELRIAKKLGIKIVMLHGEDPLVSATSYEKKSLSNIDGIFVNDETHAKNWKLLGAKTARALPYSGIDPHRYFDQKKKRNKQLVFVGTLLEDRQEMLESLINFQPEIYGYIPPEIGLKTALKPFYKGEAWGEKMVDIYNRSQIVLNFAPNHMPIGGNLRLFEIPGCGALQIANRCPNNWYEDGRSIVVYKNSIDLKKKIHFYLSNEKKRLQIAKAGYTKTHNEYTYRQRFKVILGL